MHRVIQHQPAFRTGASGGCVAVYQNQGLALPFQLVAQALPEHPKPGFLGIALICCLVQRQQRIIPDAHGVPGVGYPPGFLVNKVVSLVGNMFMELSIFLHRLLIVPGAGLHTIEALLYLDQLFLGLLEPARGIGSAAVSAT